MTAGDRVRIDLGLVEANTGNTYSLPLDLTVE